jgi:hypothetical protein
VPRGFPSVTELHIALEGMCVGIRFVLIEGTLKRLSSIAPKISNIK